MIVGQRPGASPKLLVVILALLAAAWAYREATHHSARPARSPSVSADAAQPAAITLEQPADSQPARR